MMEKGVRREGLGVRGILGLAAIAACLSGAGCKKEPKAAAAADVSGDVVVSVNGVTLTQAQADREVDIRISAMKGRVPEDQLAEGRKRMAAMVVDQFVVRTLLLQAAEKAGMTASDDEVKEALEKVKGNLPAGQTYESMVASASEGEAGLLDELTVGLKINKLLERELKDRMTVTDEEVKAFMEENKDRLQRPERVRARHILKKTEATDDEAAKAARKTEIEGWRQELVDGADFAALATEHSDCPSARQGGDLGFFTRGRMAKPFEDAAFSQELDAVGPVIETQFGYHIVQVTDKQEAGTATAAEVEQMLKQRKQQSAIREYVESLKSKADIKVKDRKPATE